MKNTKNSFLQKIKARLSWLDDKFLLILTGLLVIIIPAYPKIPLKDLIEGYIVRLRFEDLAIAFTFLVWLVQLVRKKVPFPKNTFTKMIFIYLIVGFVSSLNAVFLLHTVPMEKHHLFKLALHYFRRLEYFSIYFIAYSAIKTKKDIHLLLKVALLTLLGVVIYGFGQKYLYWPAFSTMNREFSKGLRLYLTPHSRVMSTFAGHYDYAAYLMLALVLLVSFFWTYQNLYLKILFGLLFFVAYWNLLLTASRTSWLGYLVGLTCYFAFLIKRWGLKTSCKRWFATVFFSILLMFVLGDLSERFLQLVNDPATIAKYTPYTQDQVDQKLRKVRNVMVKFSDFKLKLLASLHSSQPPANSISTEELARKQNEELARVAVPSDTPPRPAKPLPPDVTPAEEALRQKLAQEALSQASPSAAKKQTAGGYSANALKYGLSVAIRLDALWPRAIAGFKRNPILGSGYSTLVKTNPYQFTQAESTDNDYLRMLGETGILGTLSFLSLPFILIFTLFKALKTHSHDIFAHAFFLGLISATLALLVNATYIDVFESSKVAYTYWLLAALGLKYAEHHPSKN